MRQYVVCKFRPTDQRTYTYHNDGEPVAIGDKVKCPSRHGGWTAAEVVKISDQAPVFETKAIEGKV